VSPSTATVWWTRSGRAHSLRPGCHGGVPDEHSLLRRPRTTRSRQGRVRPQGHRPRAVDRRHRVRHGILLLAENPVGRSTRSPRSTTGSPSPVSAVQRVRDPAQGGDPPGRRDGLSLQPGPTSPPWPSPLPSPRRSGQIFSHEPKPFEVEILICRGGLRRAQANRLFKVTYDGTLYDERDVRGHRRKGRSPAEALRSRLPGGMSCQEAIALGVDAFRDRGPGVGRLGAAVLDRGGPPATSGNGRGARCAPIPAAGPGELSTC
jgi:hypothetical protein